MDRLRAWALKNDIKAAAALILLGAALRLLFIGAFPPGLNQDEASAGYEAWSLLNYGMDRNGCPWPVLFVSWGSGQNALYSYLSIPFIALLGLNEASLRLPMALTGSLALLVFWLMARRARGRAFALWALLLLAVNPWHVLASRWALESNLLPFMLLLGTYFLTLAEERPPMLLASAAAFALALYAYGAAFIFLPFYLAAASAVLLRRKAVGLRWYFAALAIFLLIAFPIALCDARNALGLGQTSILGLTLPKLTETRQSAVTVFGGGGAGRALRNLLSFMAVLAAQSDGLPWNSAGPFGLLYGPLGMAAVLLGLACRMRALLKKEAGKGEIYILLALPSFLAASFFIDPNVNRMNMAFLPLIWLQAEGAYAAARLSGFLRTALAAAVLLAGAAFTRYYFTAYAEAVAPCFHEGLGEALAFAEAYAEDEPDLDAIWVTDKVNMPYIYVLFNMEYPTRDFIDSVEYVNPDGAFRRASSFGRFSFGGEPPENALCIFEASDAEAMDALGIFGGYAVVKR